MNRAQTAECYALVAAAYQLEPDETNLKAWHILLGDLDGQEAIAATVRLCRRDTPFAPRPGEIIAEVERVTGDKAPSLEAAVGFYMAGEWTIHPAVERAARAVQWDRINAPDKARYQFRSMYEAELWREETGARREAEAINAGPQPLALEEATEGVAMPVDIREAMRNRLRRGKASE